MHCMASAFIQIDKSFNNFTTKTKIKQVMVAKGKGALFMNKAINSALINYKFLE